MAHTISSVKGFNAKVGYPNQVIFGTKLSLVRIFVATSDIIVIFKLFYISGVEIAALPLS